MIGKESFQEFEEDDRYVFYHPVNPIKIFGYELDNLEYEISISKNLSWTELSPILADYLEWLSLGRAELSDYFCSKLGEDLPEDWFENIEVYNASITFDSTEDFGATIEFGESVLSDHIFICDFEKHEIVDGRLNG